MFDLKKLIADHEAAVTERHRASAALLRAENEIIRFLIETGVTDEQDPMRQGEQIILSFHNDHARYSTYSSYPHTRDLGLEGRVYAQDLLMPPEERAALKAERDAERTRREAEADLAEDEDEYAEYLRLKDKFENRR